MAGAECAAASASRPLATVTAALVGRRHDSRARTRCARCAVAGRVVDRLDAAGTDVDTRNIQATAIRRACEIRVDGSSRGVRRGARGSELPARCVSPGASAPRSYPRVCRGWADADRHQSPAGPDRASGRHLLRTARSPSHVVHFREPGYAGAGRGIPRGSQRQSADGARDDKKGTMKERISALLVLVAGIAAPLFAQTPQATPMPYTAIHQPEFVAASEATFLQDDDILLGITSGNVAKAYPAGDLSQHGAVSDNVPDGPISVTWCGVCNTGLVFDAEVKGRTLHFKYDRMVGANEVQKDLETGTSWQQATGEAIDGPLKGTRLTLYPVVRTTWAVWRKRYPHTMVLEPLPGYAERMPNRSTRIKAVTRLGPEGAPTGALALDTRLPARETVAGL